MELISLDCQRKKSYVVKAKNGDMRTLLYLVNENRLDIYKVAKGILNSEDDVEDAIQNTVIKVFENIKTLKQDEFFETWMIRILINECNNIMRKNKRVLQFQESLVVENYDDIYEKLDLINAIASLNNELKIITRLYYFEDMSTVEIAKILNIPEGTVRSRLARAREKLKKQMIERNEIEFAHEIVKEKGICI
ncbi:MAG: sigma-70 family RNA polymerase sigma factor [Clostridium sp.]|uniref:RNA polymerase sigma factor n=1 Tax=Clostridium sp. TaxID=1506 RepID=UPI002A8D2F22|nr:sigma-70 family RNA polymerase sigma factor [Clostridium sp.]MDY5098034.1 sigma-70 family RNA polymerase sigma factor [Clostridium sp.]